MMNKTLSLSVAAGAIFFGASLSHAKQDGKPAAAPGDAQPVDVTPPTPPTPPAPTWSDADMEAVAKLLTGSWKSTSPIANAGADGATSAEVVLSIAPVVIKDVPNAFYAESAHAATLNRPYRQTIWQLHRVGGKLRLKTLEFRRPHGRMESLYGIWAAPEMFPSVGMGDLVATLDMVLTKDGNGWKGKTPNAYPTAAGGATEMTSELVISADRIESMDRGVNADGKQVWGPAQGEKYTLARFPSPVKVERFEGGVVAIDFATNLDGEPAKDGEMVSLNYAGYLEDGRMFDSSYERGSPFKYAKGQPLIEGWNRAMAVTQKGQTRRLVIPGPLAYGERGNPRAKIAPNATLFFDIEVLGVEPAPPPPQPVVPQPVPDQKQPEQKPSEEKPAEKPPQ